MAPATPPTARDDGPFGRPAETPSLCIAAAADLHCGAHSRGAYEAWLERVAQHAQVLLLCGDLTQHGAPEEAEVLAAELAQLRMPVLAVLGNHDLASGRPDDVRRILERRGVCVLDGEAVEIGGVGFAGVIGAAGGFACPDHDTPLHGGMAAWSDAAREAAKLECALATLRTPRKVVLMHYGETARGTPVYNAALPVLRRYADPARPFHRVHIAPRARREAACYSALNLSGLSPSQASPAANC